MVLSISEVYRSQALELERVFELGLSWFAPVDDFAGVNVNVQLDVITVMLAGHEVGHVTVIILANGLTVNNQVGTEQVGTFGRDSYYFHGLILPQIARSQAPQTHHNQR